MKSYGQMYKGEAVRASNKKKEKTTVRNNSATIQEDP
jgi:hypothetical protein